jgi:Uma2 family endonuclease
MVALPEPSLKPMSSAEFLVWEQTQERRYEYACGKVYAMTGGTIPHNDLAVNLLLALAPHVRSAGCRINVSDVKVKIRRRFRYPDLVVTCDQRDKEATKLFQYPKVIVEVLSPGTESVDRGEKLQEYQSLPTLEEYVLISTDRALVEVYRRGEGPGWWYQSYGPADVLRLESLGFSCPIGQLYAGITLPEWVEPDELDEDDLER